MRARQRVARGKLRPLIFLSFKCVHASRARTRRPAYQRRRLNDKMRRRVSERERATEETSVLTARTEILWTAVKAPELVSAAVTAPRASQYTVARRETGEERRAGDRGAAADKLSNREAANTSSVERRRHDIIYTHDARHATTVSQ